MGLFTFCYKQSAKAKIGIQSDLKYYSCNVSWWTEGAGVMLAKWPYVLLWISTCAWQRGVLPWWLLPSSLLEHKEHVQTHLSLIVWKGCELGATMAEMCWIPEKKKTISVEINLQIPSWQTHWDLGALGGVPLVYCYAVVVSEHPFWLCVCLSFCVSACCRSVLCSLAEEEIKTESDVVEGMDASVRSKGKSLKAECLASETDIWARSVSQNVEVI